MGKPARVAFAAGLLFLSCLIPERSPSQTSNSKVDFGREVHPLLAARCLMCHSAEKRSGGLSLATYADVLEGGRSGAAIKPGSGAGSLLLRRVRGEVEPRMPLGGTPLSASEIATITRWVDEGARATPTSARARPKWEAPLSLEVPPVPPVVWKDWNAPLDRFVAVYLKAGGAQEPQVVSDARFARRVYLDVWGLLPAPAELRGFLEDRSPRKREQLIAKLLADDRKYSENWISFWDDLLRNDEGVNYFSETASRKSISKWLLGALESNLPYDQFVARLLNPVAAGDPDGFLIGVNWRGAVSASQTPAMQAAQNTAQVFLGINLKCNSCHDSFISRWKLRDAYSLAAYFAPDPKLQLFRCDVAQPQFAEPAYLYPQLNRVPLSSSLSDRRAAASAIFTDPRNGRMPRTLVNRIWQRLMGRGIVENPDEMDGEPWDPQLLDWLSSDFVEHGYDLKHLIGTILTSRAYQLPAVPRTGDSSKQYSFRGPEIRRLTAEEFADAIGAITGDWHVYHPRSTGNGRYTREWHVAASPLTRALGRPIRDQVYSTRDNEATTLQALELVNGETLTHWLLRGARRMLGELPPEPVSVFDESINGSRRSAPFEVDISRVSKLWLLVEDAGSYSPEKVLAAWLNAELVGPDGGIPLASLKPLDPAGLRESSGMDAVRVKTPSRLVFDLAGKGYTTLRGTVAIENQEITSDLNPHVRFFVFGKEPNMERLTPVDPETPLPPLPALKSADEAVDRVFRYALGRAPSPSEAAIAAAALQDPRHPGRVSAEGLADLIWAVMMKPEFQLID